MYWNLCILHVLIWHHCSLGNNQNICCLIIESYVLVKVVRQVWCSNSVAFTKIPLRREWINDRIYRFERLVFQDYSLFNIWKKKSPVAGLEPATYSLEGCRATSCATRANLKSWLDWGFYQTFHLNGLGGNLILIILLWSWSVYQIVLLKVKATQNFTNKYLR